VHVDLETLHRLAIDRREALARAIARRHGKESSRSSREELDRLLELIGLFRGVFVSTTLSDDASLAHQRLGLIARPD